VTDVVVSLEYYRAVASILQEPQENLSWYSALNIVLQSHKRYYVLTIWRVCVSKFVDIKPGLLELFENVSGVLRFNWDNSVVMIEVTRISHAVWNTRTDDSEWALHQFAS